MGVCDFRGFDAILIRCIKSSVTDVFHNGSGEKMGILENNSKRAAKIIFSDILYVYSVIDYFSALDIIKTVDKIRNGGFSGAGWTDESDFLAGFCEKRKVFQNRFSFNIGKIHVVETNVTPKGNPFSVRKNPVIIVFNFFKGNFSFINFRVFIKNFKN